MRRVLHTLALLFVLILPSGLFGASPGDVSGNLQLWLKADAGITTSGSSVSKWEDQTSNGFDAKQSTSSRQPTYYDNRTNFNPSLYFNYDNLDIPNQNYIFTSKLAKLNGKKLTVFVVDKVIGGSGYRSPWTTRDDINSNGQHNTKGHILYYQNNKYRYWVGKGSGGGWADLNGSDTTGGYEIVTTTSTRASSTNVKRYIYQQGKETAGPMNSAFSPNDDKPFRIGAGATENTTASYYWSGDIAEVVAYDKKLGNADRHKVESYLAIKYGITLDQSGGGQNYKDSGGTNIIWNGPDGYRNDVAGLGRDDDSGLDQKISKSINADAIVTMATTSDFTSANAGRTTSLSTEDKRFLVWSNDDGDATWTEAGAPAGGEILDRKWHARKTGDNEHNVSIQVDVNDPDFNLPAFSGLLYFVQGKKNKLSKAKPKKMTDDGSGKWHIDGITFSDTNNENYFSFVIPPQTIPDANLIINEVLYNEPNNGEHEGEEFIEFYAKDGGEIKGMILSDQDKQIEYRFPSNCTVQQGDYVVMHRIDDSQTDSCNPGGVSHFYLNNATSTQRLGNNKDDVVLLRPSTNDKTTLADGHLFFAVPVDYISWGSKNSSGSNYDDPPTSDAGVTVSWDNSQNNRLNHEADGQSISLTRNAIDSDTSKCWEPTATTTTAYKADDCQNYLPTRDTNTDPDLTYSMGENNNAMPDMHITKTSIVISDPVNTTNNPKRIPGAIVRYCFTVDNNGTGNAQNATIHDSLTGDGRDNLEYKASGSTPAGDIATACDCANITTTNGTISGTTDVTINLGDINGTGDTAHSRACAYIKVEIK